MISYDAYIYPTLVCTRPINWWHNFGIQGMTSWGKLPQNLNGKPCFSKGRRETCLEVNSLRKAKMSPKLQTRGRNNWRYVKSRFWKVFQTANLGKWCETEGRAHKVCWNLEAQLPHTKHTVTHAPKPAECQLIQAILPESLYLVLTLSACSSHQHKRTCFNENHSLSPVFHFVQRVLTSFIKTDIHVS